MKIRLVHHWEKLRESYWFVPSLMTLAALVLAIIIAYIDRPNQQNYQHSLTSFYPIIIDAAGARVVLSTIAGSAITVAGVIFSITILILNMASTQFGPKLLRNFMDHAGTQTVLGTYVATFIYCLIVLSAVCADQEHNYVP